MDIGSNIKKYRKAKKMTQVELASRINKSESMIRKYESNSVVPNIDVLKSIADALETSFNDFLDNESYSEKTNQKYYSELDDKKLIELFEVVGLKEREYLKLSKEEKKDFIESASEINPLDLKMKNYIENFDKIKKQQLLEFYNEIKEYYNEKIMLFINGHYNELCNDRKRLIKLATLQEKRIEQLEQNIDEYDKIYKDFLNKTKDTYQI